MIGRDAVRRWWTRQTPGSRPDPDRVPARLSDGGPIVTPEHAERLGLNVDAPEPLIPRRWPVPLPAWQCVAYAIGGALLGSFVRILGDGWPERWFAAMGLYAALIGAWYLGRRSAGGAP